VPWRWDKTLRSQIERSYQVLFSVWSFQTEEASLRSHSIRVYLIFYLNNCLSWTPSVNSHTSTFAFFQKELCHMASNKTVMPVINTLILFSFLPSKMKSKYLWLRITKKTKLQLVSFWSRRALLLTQGISIIVWSIFNSNMPLLTGPGGCFPDIFLRPRRVLF